MYAYIRTYITYMHTHIYSALTDRQKRSKSASGYGTVVPECIKQTKVQRRAIPLHTRMQIRSHDAYFNSQAGSVIGSF